MGRAGPAAAGLGGAVTHANGRPSQVSHLVYSHSHSDHIGASVLFDPDVVRIGHSQCRTLLLRDNDPNRPPPEVTFEDHYTLTVGGQTLELAYHGPNHTRTTSSSTRPASRRSCSWT